MGKLCVSKADPRSVVTSPQALVLMGVVVFISPRSGHAYLGCGQQGVLWWRLADVWFTLTVKNSSTEELKSLGIPIPRK